MVDMCFRLPKELVSILHKQSREDRRVMNEQVELYIYKGLRRDGFPVGSWGGAMMMREVTSKFARLLERLQDPKKDFWVPRRGLLRKLKINADFFDEIVAEAHHLDWLEEKRIKSTEEAKVGATHYRLLAYQE